MLKQILFLILLTSSAQAMQATVVSVVDGDTLKVVNANGQATIRLYGVDSPEKKQPFGLAAKSFTSSFVEGKPVEITPMDTDRYGRTVAVIKIGTQCLQEQLLLSGYAWVYPQYCLKPFCSTWTTFQDISVGNRVGLWADPSPVQPWEWRKQ